MARIPYSRVVDVTVTREDRFASAQGFSTALLLTSTSIIGQLDATRRTKLYATIEEVAVDWLPITEEYKAAQRFFQARVRPPALKFGYFNPAGPFAAELDTLYAADPDWYWGLHLKALNDTANQRALADWAEGRNVIFGLDSNDPDTETPTAVPDASATVTMTIASPGVITWNAHGLAAGDPVRLATTGALPTGLTAGTIYYVAATPAPAANTFSLAATAGGTAIATTGTQSGTHTATAPKFGGSIAEYCESKSYDRSPVFYHTYPDSYLAAAAWGYAAGRNLDRSNYALARRGRIDSGQAYTLKFKNLPGVTALNKSSAVVQAITGFVPSLGVQGDAGHAAASAALAHQVDAAAFPVSGGTATVSVAGPAGCTFARLTLDGATPADGLPARATAPLGVLRFAATGCTGATLQVQVRYPTGSLAGLAPHKHGPHGGQTGWFAHGAASGDTVAYTVADNGDGDNDPAPGVIADPFAPLLLGAAPPAGAQAIPTLSQWGVLLLSLPVGLLGWRRSRAKTTRNA